MTDKLVAEILTSDSDEIADLLSNQPLLEAFIELARKLDGLQEINKRFYEDSRSLFQATCTNLPINDLEALLAEFFGPPVKPVDKPLPRKLKKNSSVKYLGGIEKDQSLFLLPLKTGEFYGALWPWRRNKAKVEIHLGYCSDWMTDEDYFQLETLIKKSVSKSAFEKMDTNVGGQIHGISLPSFLQMAEMEQSTFALRITSAGQVGTLHIFEGQLIAAELDQWTGRDAAYRIIAWDDATVEIAPAAPSKTDEIKQPLMHVLMESLKIKDDITAPLDQPPIPPPAKKKKGGAKPAATKPQKRLVQLERAPTPRIKRKRLGIIALTALALGIIVIAGTSTVVGLYVMNKRSKTDQWQQISKMADRLPTLEEKQSLLQSFLETNPRTPFSSEIKSRISQISRKIESQEFEKVTLKVSTLPVDENFERTAVEMYGSFMQKYPDSAFSKEITAAIADIKTLVDQYYYEELKRAARMDLHERLDVYNHYLKQFPEGRYQEDVKVLINEMGEQHLNYLKAEDSKCEQNQTWEICIQRYQNFIANFNGLPLSKEAQRSMKALEDKRDLVRLRKLKDEADNDYLKAYKAYKTYLAEHPDSTQKKAIEQALSELSRKLDLQRKWQAVRSYATSSKNSLFERIQRVDRYLKANSSGPYVGEARELMNTLEGQRRLALRRNQIEEEKMAARERIRIEEEKRAQQLQHIQQMQRQLEQELKNSKRFRINGNGTATDQSTGKTWALIDSYDELGGCINYQDAKRYARGLVLGGHRDWRLPTANELAAIYKQTPFFPQTGAKWYWTADAYARGYHSVADVVTSKPETLFEREYRKQDACGAVRAVRP